MRRIVFLFPIFAAALTSLAVDPVITNIVARQRWPLSGTVDIDFTLLGTNTAVKFIASHDGGEPFVLDEKDIAGPIHMALEPDRTYSVSWDPVRAGLGNTELKNFKVTVVPDDSDRTYLILNLVDGSYVYVSEPPEGGWLSDPAYYTTNMVFRRVPAGTFIQGYSDDVLDKLSFGGYDLAMSAREMTLSSDYYMAVFKTTTGQHRYVCSTTNGIPEIPNVTSAETLSKEIDAVTYNALRGRTNEVDGINWPHTGYAVAPGSIIAAYRKITENTFPVDWTIDLPTVTQWARAARANTPDGQIWHVGGTVEDSLETLTNLALQVGYWTKSKGKGYSSTKLGQFVPNGWGFYDFNGTSFEWALDWFGWTKSATDPVGPDTNSRGYRARCGSYQDGKHIAWMVPGFVYYYGADNTNPGYRLCIHLKRLKTE